MWKLLALLCIQISLFGQTTSQNPVSKPAVVKPKRDNPENLEKARMLGTFLGFGTGHAKLGEYAPKGMIFTITEGAPILITAFTGFIMVLNSVQTDCSSGTCESYDWRPWYKIALVSAGILTIARIAEVSDLWFFHKKPESTEEKPYVFSEPSLLESNSRPALVWNLGLKF